MSYIQTSTHTYTHTHTHTHTHRLEKHTQSGGIIKRENLHFSIKHISLNQPLCRHQWVTIISLSSHFIILQNNVKKSERLVSAVNNSGHYTLGTSDGMFI